MRCSDADCTDINCVPSDGSTHPITDPQEGSTMSTITANRITILTRDNVARNMYHVGDNGPSMFWWHPDITEAENRYHQTRRLLTAAQRYGSGTERAVSSFPSGSHAGPLEPMVRDRFGEYYRDDWMSEWVDRVQPPTGHFVTTVDHIDGAVLTTDLFLYHHVDEETSQWLLMAPTPPHPSATPAAAPLPESLVGLGLWTYPVTDEQAERAVTESPEVAAHREVERALATLREAMAERDRFAAGVVKQARRAKHDHSWCGEVEGMLEDAGVDATWTSDVEMTVTLSLQNVTGQIAQSETSVIGEVREALRATLRQMLSESRRPATSRWSDTLGKATLVSMDATGTVTEKVQA